MYLPGVVSDFTQMTWYYSEDATENIFFFFQIISRNDKYTQFFFQIADRGCELGDSDLRDAARNILRIIPPDQTTMRNLFVSPVTALLSRVYIWMRTRMMHVDERRGRMYGTFVHCSAFAEAANRPDINILYVNFLWSTDRRQITFRCSLNIRRIAECCLPRLSNTSTLNDDFVFACRIRIPFTFRCKPGFILYFQKVDFWKCFHTFFLIN